MQFLSRRLSLMSLEYISIKQKTKKKFANQVYFGTFWQFVCELGKARQVSDEEYFSCSLQFCTVNFFACSLHKPRFGFVYSLNSCSSSSNVQQQHGISPTSSDKKKLGCYFNSLLFTWKLVFLNFCMWLLLQDSIKMDVL